MALSDHVLTLGQWLLTKYGERVHKIALDAGMTCPNRDGSKGVGGCTFCNNASFSPNSAGEVGSAIAGPAAPVALPRVTRKRLPATLAAQLDSGRRAIARRTGARKFLAYFQAYTNTYAEAARLRALYDEALAHPDVIGLSVGTRPDCVPDAVLDLLAEYRAQGREVWLELGLQSAFDDTLARVNRGHGFAEYEATCRAARARGLPVCAHLILGLPGETDWHARQSLARVLAVGVDGLKLHPLHVVRHTVLAQQWRRGDYAPMALADYVLLAADLIERTPAEVIYHRVTGTASADILLAPAWCQYKWRVLDGIAAELARRGTRQGSLAGRQAGTEAVPAGLSEAGAAVIRTLAQPA